MKLGTISKRPLIQLLQGKFYYPSFNVFYYRWCVYELEWDAEDGRKMSKVVLIAFAPDNAANN